MPRKQPKNSTRKLQVITMLDADDAKAVREAAQAEDLTVSHWVRRTIKKAIDH